MIQISTAAEAHRLRKDSRQNKDTIKLALTTLFLVEKKWCLLQRLFSRRKHIDSFRLPVGDRKIDIMNNLLIIYRKYKVSARGREIFLILGPTHHSQSIFEPSFCRNRPQNNYIPQILTIDVKSSGQASPCFASNPSLNPHYIAFFQQFIGVGPVYRFTEYLSILEKLESAFMGCCFHYFAKCCIIHSLLAHQINIFTAAVVVDMIKTVRICKPSFIHAQIFAFVVHKAHKLNVVKFDALIIFGKVDTSNL